jgi:N12 class adenine-specific DNA methylase
VTFFSCFFPPSPLTSCKGNIYMWGRGFLKIMPQALVYITERNKVYNNNNNNNNSMALVRKRTIPTEWLLLVGEVNTNFCR